MSTLEYIMNSPAVIAIFLFLFYLLFVVCGRAAKVNRALAKVEREIDEWDDAFLDGLSKKYPRGNNGGGGGGGCGKYPNCACGPKKDGPPK